MEFAVKHVKTGRFLTFKGLETSKTPKFLRGMSPSLLENYLIESNGLMPISITRKDAQLLCNDFTLVEDPNWKTDFSNVMISW